MNWATICAAVIPCHNEQASIGLLAREVQRFVTVVIVADDGSDDRTGELARKSGAQVVRLERNSGKGAALKAGINAAINQGFDWALTLDGDGQHLPEDIPAFFCTAVETGAALVIGNRMQNATSMPWLRRFVNRWMSRRISKLAGKSVPDSQCGFRLINLKAWSALKMESDHFEIESEMLLSFIRAGCGVEFIPIKLVPTGLHSHIHPVRDTWRWMKWWRRTHKSLPVGSRRSITH